MSPTPASSAGCAISDVVFDSRLVTPGCLFVALRGGYADGHRFIAEVASRGAIAVLVEESVPVSADIRAQALVPDTRAALAVVAANWYQHPAHDLTVIGVTGTNGKTTTTAMITNVLDAAGLRSAFLGTVEMKLGADRWPNPNHQTTPESLHIQRFLRQAVAAGCSHAVLEATSHGLAMHRLDALPVDVAVFTNLSHDHLEYHQTFAAYLAAKRGLFERLNVAPERGTRRWAVVNAHDAHADDFLTAAPEATPLRYGIETETPIAATTVMELPEHVVFTLQTPAGSAAVHLNTLGTYNVLNALAAAAVGHAQGIDVSTIAAGLGEFADVAGHLERIEMGQPYAVIVDFAHTPAAFEALFGLLRRTTQGRLGVVFGSAGERDQAKRLMQGAIAARYADLAIFTNEDPRFEDAEAILRAIAAGAEAERPEWREGEQYHCIADRAAAIGAALDWAAPGDTVALVGKGHEHSIIIGADALPWDEAAIARAALRERGYPGDR
ncbi:MAG: UDP-N-acetylmuramoyl-L-alanyl-D-glutamate--2,6-diaminopimelate ligase [Thermomicrobia bacterium]|nr:UDP-N-acetylmuramoyl-L-alanyl-D-glutamate--2,6-diaminopimelate ligase [Thermomicrobia bacterium]